MKPRLAPHSHNRAQAKVFRLARDDGSPTGKVIKINHSGGWAGGWVRLSGHAGGVDVGGQRGSLRERKEGGQGRQRSRPARPAGWHATVVYGHGPPPTPPSLTLSHGPCRPPADPISKSLNNNVVWVGMDREWEIGTQLRAALQEPGGNVPGFMKVGGCEPLSCGGAAAGRLW